MPKHERLARNGSATMRAVPEQLKQVRAAIMLAGALRAHELRRAARRSLLELPVAADVTLLDFWRRQWLSLATQTACQRLPVRVMVDHSLPLSSATARHGPIELSIEQDPVAFRGPGGLLRDVAEHYDDDDRLLVVHAAQLMSQPLTRLAEALAHKDADVAVLAQPDGAPAGMTLLRCGCLRQVASVGFVDFNEQVLPSLAKSWDVRVAHWPCRVGQAVRTPMGYIEALRLHHQQAGQASDADHPLKEDWHGSFSIVEPGADVAPSARLQDSVVLAGARVAANAEVVRSVVCPGAVVHRAQPAVDALVRAEASARLAHGNATRLP
jgi:NDP-sugar pyrophosphorylase family protein